VKREEEAYQNRNTGALQSLPAATAASPTYPYPSGPPPPYSQPPPATAHHANTWPGAQLGARTPPDSRRTIGEEQDAKQTTRQSLPSISEALGVDSQTSYPSSTPAPPAAISAPTSHSQSVAPPSPKRSFPMEPPPAPHNAYTSSGTYPSFPQFRPEVPPQQSYAVHVSPRPTYAADRPSLQVQTSHVPPPPQQPSAYGHPTNSSPHYEQPSSHSAGSMGPSSLPYGYTPYPPRYAQPTPPSSVTGGPIYQPSLSYPAPPTPSQSWKSESSTRYGDDRSAEYSTSVKRHLDLYDLEGALNDVCHLITTVDSTAY